MRVLLIEDEPTTAKSIELMLGTEGFNVYTTDLGEEGLDLGKLYDYDIILLDLNLPDMHGYDVLKKLRTAKVSTPVLILSGIGEMDSKVRALGFGADDYVTKPFSPREVGLRIRAILRRGEKPEERIKAGPISIDPARHEVRVDGKRVHLTSLEFKLLRTLMQRRGRVQDRDKLLNEVWGYEAVIDTRTVDTHVRRLREKLGEAGDVIETVRGFGYRLREE